jgi:hypothetical protein
MKRMKLTNLIAVSGIAGIHKMAANRSNGLIIEELETGKRRFVSSRQHQFTPLESIAIYTDDGESVELAQVFRNMLEQYEDRQPVAPTASAKELFEYFADVLPNYDPERVYPGDVKKVIKWFNSLHSSGLLTASDEEE